MALCGFVCSPRIAAAFRWSQRALLRHVRRSPPAPMPLVLAAMPLALAVMPLALVGANAGRADEPMAPYVPTVEEDVELMLDVADVGADDYLIDLGSGDGRIVIAAARRGAYGHGIEIEPDLVETAARNAREAEVDDRVVFVEGDVFEADIAAASVVTLYLFPETNLALRPRLLAQLRPGTRVVSNSFGMGDWAPDVHDTSARSSGGVLMWVVPADAAGEWALEIAGEESEEDTAPDTLHVDQRYQQVDVRLDGREKTSAAEVWNVASAELRGDRLVFRARAGAASYAFTGRIDGDSMTGFVQIRDAAGERIGRWRARR